MAKKDKMYMPMGSGGLIRYSEEEKELIKVKPKQVVVVVVGIIIVELLLKFMFAA
jgi:preprotein translocase subunit Sec61beta